MRPESRREPSASFKRTVAQVRCCANAGFSEVNKSRSQEFRSNAYGREQIQESNPLVADLNSSRTETAVILNPELLQLLVIRLHFNP